MIRTLIFVYNLIFSWKTSKIKCILKILVHDILQIMLLVQYMHTWSIICIPSLSINIFVQLLSYFYSHNCSTHRVSAASEGVALSVQKNWYIIYTSKLTWRKWCKVNRWVFQTFLTIKERHYVKQCQKTWTMTNK